MSTVRADNFCPVDWTIWQCFKSEFAVHKSFLRLLSLLLYSPSCFSQTPTLLLVLLILSLILLSPSGSRLREPLTAVNQTIFLVPSINRVLKKLAVYIPTRGLILCYTPYTKNLLPWLQVCSCTEHSSMGRGFEGRAAAPQRWRRRDLGAVSFKKSD